MLFLSFCLLFASFYLKRWFWHEVLDPALSLRRTAAAVGWCALVASVFELPVLLLVFVAVLS